MAVPTGRTSSINTQSKTLSPQSSKSEPHILIIDDDPVFRKMVEKRGAQRKMHVTVCGSLRELNPMTATRLFDAAIVDYFLDDLKDHLRGTDVAAALEGTPIILTSSTDSVVDMNDPWSSSVRKFVNKKNGIDCLLDEALELARHEEKGGKEAVS